MAHFDPARRNLVYAEYPGQQMLLDLYRPDTDRPCPTVIFFHGGGWKSGGKDHDKVRWLTRYGFAVASVNYRLLPRYCFPAQIHDAKAAVRFLRARAEDYGLEPTQFAATGISSGAYLANLLGVTAGHAQLDAPAADDPFAPDDFLNESTRLQAVVNYFGFTDFLELQRDVSRRGLHRAERSPEAGLLGQPVARDMAWARLASPLHHVSAEAGAGYPAFLHLHGDRNETVPPDQSRRFHEALQAAGARSKLLVVRGVDHRSSALIDSPGLRDRVADFLHQHLATTGMRHVHEERHPRLPEDHATI